MQKNIKSLLLVTTCIIFLCNTVQANPIGGELPASMNFGGSLLNHDLMMLKEKQRLHDENVDFDNFHERNLKKHQKNDSVINDNTTPSEKIFDAETSKELKQKQKQEELIKQKKNKKSFFNKHRQDKEKILDNEQTSSITKEENTTVIEAKAEETVIDKDRIYIKAIKMTNSRILTDFELQTITDDIIGKYASFEDLEQLIQNINYLYASKGFVTAKAFLPPQTIEHGILKISLVEGTVGKIEVSNNKYTSSNFIKKRISQKEDELFQIVQLEKDIVKFNKYNEGIKLSATLDRGAEQGTTDVKIVAEEKFPFHIVGIMDNAGRKTIGELRGGLMLYSDSLFKQRDRLTLGSYASRYSVTPFADYNIPVNKYDGRVGFMFSSSFADIGDGPYKMFDISSKSYNYSLYYTQPLIRKPNFELSSYSSINYKQAATEFAGYELDKDKITSFETALNARWDTKRGLWYINQGVYQAFPIFDDGSKYFKYTGNITRLHDFGHGIVGQFRGMYQFSPKDVMPYIDQFQAGGLATVRGYSEGLLIGRSGYLLSAEVMFPIAPQQIKYKNKAKESKSIPFLGKVVKGIAFVDHAGVYPYKGEGPGAGSYDSSDYMISMGLGLRIQLPGDLTARLYWGYPLMHNRHETYYRNPRFSFSLSLAPDFDKLLKYRKSLREKHNNENL